MLILSNDKRCLLQPQYLRYEPCSHSICPVVSRRPQCRVSAGVCQCGIVKYLAVSRRVLYALATAPCRLRVGLMNQPKFSTQSAGYFSIRRGLTLQCFLCVPCKKSIMMTVESAQSINYKKLRVVQPSGRYVRGLLLACTNYINIFDCYIALITTKCFIF